MSDTSYKKGFVYVKGYDDFGDEVVLSGLQVTPSIGAADYKASSGLVTVYADPNKDTDTTNSFLLTPTVVLTATYQNGTTVLTKSASLTVSAQAYVASMEFGELETTSTTKREDGKLTIAELATSKYFLPVSNVKDQYDNDLDADRLNGMINANSGGTNTSGTLYITPNVNATQYFAFKEFGTLKDGRTVAYITTGNGKPGKSNLQITSVGGGAFSKEVEVVDNPFIQKLNVSIPELYMSTEAEVTFTAVDQYGNDINLYDFAPTPKLGSVGGTANVLEFGDVNNLTNQKTTVSMTAGQTWKVTKNTSKKTFTVKLAPAGTVTNIVFTTATAGLETGTQTITVASQATPESIYKYLGKTGSDEAVIGGQVTSYEFAKNLTFYDTNSAVCDRSVLGALYPTLANVGSPLTANKTIYASKQTGATYDAYVWTLTADEVSASVYDATTAPTGGTNSVTELNDGVTDGTYYASLFAEEASTTPDHYVLLDSKKFKVIAATTDLLKAKNFAASVVSGSVTSGAAKDLLFVGKDSTDKAYIKVTAQDANNNTFQVSTDKYSVTVEKGLTATGAVVSGKDATLGAGSAVAHVWIDTDSDGVAEDVATATVNYDVAAPTAKGIQLFNTSDNAVSNADELSGVTSVAVTDGIMTIAASNKNYKLALYDQYGQDMATTVYQLNGKDYAAGVTLKANTSYALAASYKGLDSRTVTLTIGTGDVTTTKTSTGSTTTADVSSLKLTGPALVGNFGTLVANTAGTTKVSVYKVTSGVEALQTATNNYSVQITNGSGTVVGYVDLSATNKAATQNTISATATRIGLYSVAATDGSFNVYTAANTAPGTYKITVTDADAHTASVEVSVGKASEAPATTTTLNVSGIAETYAAGTYTTTVTVGTNDANLTGTFKLLNDGVETGLTKTGKISTTNTIVFTSTVGTELGAAASSGAFSAGSYKIEFTPDATLYGTTTTITSDTAYTTAPSYTAVCKTATFADSATSATATIANGGAVTAPSTALSKTISVKDQHGVAIANATSVLTFSGAPVATAATQTLTPGTNSITGGVLTVGTLTLGAQETANKTWQATLGEVTFTVEYTTAWASGTTDGVLTMTIE